MFLANVTVNTINVILPHEQVENAHPSVYSSGFLLPSSFPGLGWEENHLATGQGSGPKEGGTL